MICNQYHNGSRAKSVKIKQLSTVLLRNESNKICSCKVFTRFATRHGVPIGGSVLIAGMRHLWSWETVAHVGAVSALLQSKSHFRQIRKSRFELPKKLKPGVFVTRYLQCLHEMIYRTVALGILPV